MPETFSGKLADPKWRHERARKASRARTTPDYHLTRLREIVEQTRAEQDLPPVVTDDLTLAKVADLIRSAEKGAAGSDVAC